MSAYEFAPYVGLPYRDQGRDRAGVDCYGLLRLVYAEMAGLVLPSYSDEYVTTEDGEALQALIAGRLEPWREVASGAVRPLDALLMRYGREESHIGVVVRRGLVLHTGLHVGASRIESYTSMKLRRRVSRFLRHEALNEPGP